MMSGLMLIFLFISISFMMKVDAQKQKMKDIAIEYRDTKANLNEALFSEFEDDLSSWDAVISKENSITFNSPDILFQTGKSDITDKFKSVLDSFFSRYIKILTSKEYKNEIKGLRIEGYTSNRWGNLTNKKEIYLKNMQLSQMRAYKVLAYCYSLENETIKKNRTWLQKHFRANGMAFSKLKKNDKARRVEFSIEMKSEDKVYDILK